MRYMKFFSIIAACILCTACQKTEWDTIIPDPSSLYGNNSITEENLVTIKQLKENYKGVWNSSTDMNMLISTETKIKGRVTGNDIRGNIYKQFMLQDETGAIIVCVNESGISGYLAEGQEIIMDLKGLYIGGYRKMPEIGMPYNGTGIGRMSKDVFQKHFKFTNGGIKAVEPIAFDINMDKDEHCGKLVTLRGVSFKPVLDPAGSFAPGDGSVAITGGCVNRELSSFSSSKIVIRTSTYAKFAANPLPQGPVDITGIATRYNNTWQILIRKENDIIRK